MQVSGMAALVTGGGSGLGAATAEALAAKGGRVAVLDLDQAAAERVAALIGGIAVQCDVADAASGERAVATAREAHGPARILVNCAGVATPGRIVGRDGPLKLEALEDGERGLVVNTASVAAFEGQIGQAAYASSKGGVASLTLPAARELARSGIRVMTIAPGLFGTPMLRGLPEEVQTSLGASVPFPARLGEPTEYAALVLHIAENRMLNGAVLRLDGALRMAPR